MADTLAHTMHALVIPTTRVPMLVPSAITAEIMSVPRLNPLPFSENWLLGVIGWRNRAVPVISFENLLGDPAPPIFHHRSKVVIFQPLSGLSEWDFFGILASADPHPYNVNTATDLKASSTPITSPLVATTVTVGRTAVVIPDLDGLRRALYPGR